MDNPRADRVRTVRSLGGRSAQSRTGLLLVEGPGAVLELVTWRPECVTDVYVTERVEESQPEILEQARQATRWVHRVTDEVAHAMTVRASSRSLDTTRLLRRCRALTHWQ